MYRMCNNISKKSQNHENSDISKAKYIALRENREQRNLHAQ